MAYGNLGSVNAYDTFDRSEVDVSIKVGKWQCSSCQLLVFLLLLATVIGLVVFISLTYALNLQCQGKDGSQKAKSNNLVSFLLFSDIHLDRFYKDSAPSSTFCWNGSISSNYIAKYGRIKCDSPRRLLQSTLTAMKNRSSELHKLEFILLTGDTCAHRMDKRFSNSTVRRYNTLKTIKESSDEVKTAFPSIPYFPSVGNNDLPAHYVLPGPNDSWYGDLLDIWQDSILCTKCKNSHNTTTKKELRRTFLKGGYYNASVADGTMTLLVLNSMYWTKNLWKSDAYFIETAAAQINWLENQLYLARKLNKKVLITSHIPPGIDPFPNKERYSALWLGNFTKLYAELVVNKYSDVIAGQLYAHFHKDSFRFLHNESSDPTFKNSSFVLLIPSISPIYNNNPSFRVVHLDPDQQAMVDYEQYFMNLVMATEFDNPVWQLDYKFSAKYPSKGLEDRVINAMRIKSLNDNLINQTNDDVFTGFINSHQVRYQPDKFSRFIFYCLVRYFSQEDFDKCQKSHVVPGG